MEFHESSEKAVVEKTQRYLNQTFNKRKSRKLDKITKSEFLVNKSLVNYQRKNSFSLSRRERSPF